MKTLLQKAIWYIKLVFVFARVSLISQMEYRLNFISGVCVETAYLFIKLIYLVVVLQTGVNIGNLTPNMVIIFVGTYLFMTGISMLLQGVNSLSGSVISGSLDTLLVKPGSLLFLQTFGNFNFGMMFPNVTAGIILICTGWARAGVAVTLPTVAGFVFFILLSMALTYAFCLMPTLLVFWVTSINGINKIFWALWDFNNMPMAQYNTLVRQIGTFIIPVFLLTNWPGLFILDMLSPVQFIWGLAAPVILICVSRMILKRGLKRYISANG